ncbi:MULTISPECIES: helicase-exonuclease AddAB subunit AddA [unclassified Paenibacillus]|uniref:helicase-exonuclease AddAB subunit AddA n=1 Tax=unclassified Paenibacillus TaxID=185978 RepID=UPI000839B540|nr:MULTISPECIES: helicase-exonuclease AddAB subunit AddA [unclassified Paenibacillus]NWL86874.1 helicase-exonuclease AddAB subunit AddA [Paenibacillus sp. 79R4]
MNMPKPQGSFWSDDQWRAITLTGGDILVAAAAGSGKTAVLVERIIRKLSSREHPLDVDRLLVATFTKAAASEMRGRIREALEKELVQDPGNEHLTRQLAMLGRASITTLHSFCMEVIQRYYTLIPLDPGFRIAAESETALLRQEVLEQLFEDKYASAADGNRFLSLVDWFGGERSDDAVFSLVLKLYDFAQSHSWPEHWLLEAADAFAAPDAAALENSLWVQSIVRDTELALIGAADLLRQARTIAEAPGGPQPYAVTFADDIQVIGSLLTAVQESPWAGLYDIFQSVSFGKLKPCKKDQTDPLLQERAKTLREEAKKLVSELQTQLFGRTPEAYLDELHQAAPLMRELAELIAEFGARYRTDKTARGWLDFADLEHYCLQILRHPDSTPGNLQPSAAALEYQAQYDEVLLDEYQDTNTVQEDIISLIARTAPGNRFMVGDVKQSIYRFRLAEPGLFLQKYRSYGDEIGEQGLRIDLARNFRSRREVVHAVNMLFRQMMNESAMEIEYDERAELVYGEGFPDSEQNGDEYRPELLLIDRSKDSLASMTEADSADGVEGSSETEEAIELEAVQLEARAIAERIRKLLGEGGRPPLQIYDKQLRAMRPVAYRDMTILLRSTLSWAPVMIEELRREGIPAAAELSQGYFQASEVDTMLSLLQVIDNPLQDIPLAAVLRSPLYGFSEEELAEIRLAAERGHFYEAVLSAAQSEAGHSGETELAAHDSKSRWVMAEDEGTAANLRPGENAIVAGEVSAAGVDRANETCSTADGSSLTLGVRLQRFLSQLSGWRNRAREGELSDLIWGIFRDTGYLDWVGGLPGGSQRQSNLRALYDRATQYESATSSRGLFRFLRYIQRLKDNGGDLGAAASAEGQEDAVSIMTIHKSKGLEFPVVFVAGLSRMFNRQDLNAPFLIHKEMGFGPKYIDSELRVSYPTLPNLAIRRRAQMELLAEEMRVLYVALTRPKEKLILVSSVKDLVKSAQNWGGVLEVQDERLPDYVLVRGRCYLDWIGPALIRHAAAAELRRFGGLPELMSTALVDSRSAWAIELVSAQEVAVPAARIEAAAAGMGGALEEFGLNSLPADEGEHAAAEFGRDELDTLIKSRLNWVYPHTAATRISAKTSVTEMKSLHRTEEESAVSLFATAEMKQEMSQSAEQVEFKLHLRRPRFMEQAKLTATERGTAYHTVMQHLPFDKGRGEAVVAELLQSLIEKKIMTVEQAAEIDTARIAEFWNSPIGKLLDRADWIKRELPFSYGLSAAEAYPTLAPLAELFAGSATLSETSGNIVDIASTSLIDGSVNSADSAAEADKTSDPDRLYALAGLDGETVLIQGVVDCLFYADGKQYLLDYKSDKVLEHRGGVKALAESYRFQLDLYARAIEDITGVPVEEKWLYFLDSGDVIQL